MQMLKLSKGYAWMRHVGSLCESSGCCWSRVAFLTVAKLQTNFKTAKTACLFVNTPHFGAGGGTPSAMLWALMYAFARSLDDHTASMVPRLMCCGGFQVSWTTLNSSICHQGMLCVLCCQNAKKTNAYMHVRRKTGCLCFKSIQKAKEIAGNGA